MKLIIQNNRIAGTATDDYTGPDEFITAPEGFDIANMSAYTVAGGVLSLAIPSVVTIRQARLALNQFNLLDSVNAVIAGSNDKSLQIEWEFCTEVKRSWPALVALQPALSLTDREIDDLFVLAATL
jgi:hypothetical protein